MDASSIKATSSSPTATTQDAKGENSVLGKDDFLKLFVAQLKYQDPMNPMQDMEFMGQMASFSTLEQISNMARANEVMAVNLHLNQSVGLIGRTVTWTDAQSETHTGVVEKVTTTNGYPTLTVSGTEGVDPSLITQIA